MLFLAEKHIREDPDVSASYGDFLVEVMNCTEADCAMKDDELDAAEQKKKIRTAARSQFTRKKETLTQLIEAKTELEHLEGPFYK